MQRNSEQILTEWLVLHAQSGNAAALDQLLKIWYPKFLRYATHQLRNAEAAKDVVQETLFAVAKSIGKLEDPATFPKWAYQILQRRGVDYLRKEIRIRRNSAIEGNPPWHIDNDSGVGMDTRLALGKALDSLKTDSYQIVHLRYLIGLNLKEIAAVMGIPEGTVKSRLHSARVQLRKLLTE